MATTVARLQAILSADTGQFDKAMHRSETTMQKVGGGFQKAALPAAAALTAIGVGAKKAIDDASNLGEQMNKTAVVFGDSGKEVQKWSKGLTKNFGLSQRAALEAAGTYGNMLKPMGILPKKTKEISTRMVELAGDMASFNNASPQETLDALRSGLAGETEPLRKFGVFLDQASIKAEAVASGLVKAKVSITDVREAQIKANEAQKEAADALRKHGAGSVEYAKAAIDQEQAENKLAKALGGKVGNLSAAEKAMASYQIITRSTKDAQGDFARTSDSVANQARITAAEQENLRAKMGKGLLPAYQAVQKAIISVTGFLAGHTSTTKIAVGIVAGLAATVLAVNAAMKLSAAATALSSVAFIGLGTSATVADKMMRLTLIGALATLAIGVVAAYQKSETFRNIVGTLVEKLKTFGGWIREHFPAAKAAFMKALDPIVAAFELWWSALSKIIDGVKWLIGKASAIGGVLGKLGGLIGDPRDPNMTAPGHSSGGINLMGALPVMAPFAASAAGFGLSVTSGLRPGAITANGTPSDHAVGKALDVAGSAGGMAAFFKSLIGNRMVKQAFYDPLGSIFGGAWNSYREGGHSDHVHVATYDKGGYLKPGWNLAYNGLGRPEPVGAAMGPSMIVLDMGDMGVHRFVRKEKQRYERLNGPGSW